LTSTARPLLESGLAQLELCADRRRIDAWLAHLEELRRWNRAYNLVGSGELPNLVSRHLLDSLSIHAFLAPGPLLDVGTGAGFPGLPLAIADPDREVWLLDAAGKKVRFLRHVLRRLEAANVQVVQGRAESFSPGVEFSNIVSRAFSSLRGFVTAIRHLASPATRLLAMKGRRPDAELADLPDWIRLDSCRRIHVPGLASERFLVSLGVTGGEPGSRPNSGNDEPGDEREGSRASRRARSALSTDPDKPPRSCRAPSAPDPGMSWRASSP
jgi:16S rRNA (guanine527-N7)-methyltransferase